MLFNTTIESSDKKSEIHAFEGYKKILRDVVSNIKTSHNVVCVGGEIWDAMDGCRNVILKNEFRYSVLAFPSPLAHKSTPYPDKKFKTKPMKTSLHGEDQSKLSKMNGYKPIQKSHLKKSNSGLSVVWNLLNTKNCKL